MNYIGQVNSNKAKYLYFRTEATDANDDATGDSALFPASSLMGMQPTGDSELTLYFKSMLRGSVLGAESNVSASQNNDSVAVTLATANTHIMAMSAIIEAINNPNLPSVIVVANDDSGGTEYLLKSNITACGTITVAAAYS
tara:strand:+ start:612 stop:1034 length:423 start_codon:yes stop_codon:yes gene_type:complete